MNTITTCFVSFMGSPYVRPWFCRRVRIKFRWTKITQGPFWFFLLFLFSPHDQSSKESILGDWGISGGFNLLSPKLFPFFVKEKKFKYRSNIEGALQNNWVFLWWFFVQLFVNQSNHSLATCQHTCMRAMIHSNSRMYILIFWKQH